MWNHYVWGILALMSLVSLFINLKTVNLGLNSPVWRAAFWSISATNLLLFSRRIVIIVHTFYDTDANPFAPPADWADIFISIVSPAAINVTMLVFSFAFWLFMKDYVYELKDHFRK